MTKRRLARCGVLLLSIAALVVGGYYLAWIDTVPGIQLPTEFFFDPWRAGLEASLARDSKDLVVTKGESVFSTTLTFLRDGEAVLTLAADPASVFCRDDGVLFFVRPHIVGCGGSINAYSLTNGRMLWSRALKAVGSVDHYHYSNDVTLDVSAHTLMVTGTESYGDYVEVFHRGTGWRLGHKVYRTGFRPLREGASPFLRSW